MPASGSRLRNKPVTIVNNRFGITIQRTILAGVFSTLASLAIAEVVTDGVGNRFRLVADGAAAELTYLATDSANASAYVGDLEVPSTVIKSGKWLPVTGVTALACANCDALISVTLPDGVTTIGLGAFSDCPSLVEAQLPSSLAELHDLAFYRDASLRQVEVPSSVARLGSSAFAFCSQLDSIGLKQGLQSIARQSFYYCTSLTHVYVPGSVNAIGEYAFAYCSGLQELLIAGAPLAVTPDVFEGVDVSQCRLIVPSDEVEAYRAAEVWRDFQIEGGCEGLPQIELDESDFFSYRIDGDELWLDVKGDAPALVYDLMGRCIAVAASRSGENRVSIVRGRNYIIRCGRITKSVITL